MTIFGLFAILLTGCGGGEGSVTGKVTYQSKPLKGGTVAFISTEGHPSGTANIKEDGSYEVPKLMAGNYKVIVDTESLLPQRGAGTYGKGGGSAVPKDSKTVGPPPGAKIPDGYKTMNPNDADAALKENAKRYVKIPPQYNKPDESGLEFTAVSGPQTHNIELK